MRAIETVDVNYPASPENIGYHSLAGQLRVEKILKASALSSPRSHLKRRTGDNLANLRATSPYVRHGGIGLSL